MSDKINLVNFGLIDLETFMQKIGEPKFRATQLIQWIHQHGVIDFANMSNFSKVLREKLAAICEIKFPEIMIRKLAKDGTCKWLMRLPGGNSIETVFIPGGKRGTLCVSSQIGCALNCSFCSTGKEGFNRNLDLSEIIGQVWLAKNELQTLGLVNDRVITNVVMMGMGEPLLNYDNVIHAMDLMLSDHAYGLSKYRVTLSTSGVVPKIEKLKQDSPVALAVSLHAPNNELRNQLVPINKKYPLEVLMPLCRDYFKNTKRQIVYEYVMLDGVNDSVMHAKQLIKLLANQSCKINLIPFNPFPKTQYKTSTPEAIDKFAKLLVNAGFNTRTRRTRGEDIDAACGQLAGEFKDRTGRHARWLKTGKLVTVSTDSR